MAKTHQEHFQKKSGNSKTTGRKFMKEIWNIRRRRPCGEFSSCMQNSFYYDRWQPVTVGTVGATGVYT